MEAYESPVRFLAAAVMTATAALLFIRFNISSMSGMTYPFFSICLCFTVIMASAYHWMTGRGKIAAIGLDRTHYSEEEIREFVSYHGFWHMIASMLFLFGLSCLFVNSLMGLLFIAMAVIILVVSMCAPALGKDVNSLIELKSETAALILALVIFLSLVPSSFLFIDGVHNVENNQVDRYNPFKLNGSMNDNAESGPVEYAGAYMEEYSPEPVLSVNDVFADGNMPVQLPSGNASDTVFYSIHSMTAYGMV